MKVKEEPADIHPEFVKIAKLLIEANKSQKALQSPYSRETTNIVNVQRKQGVKVPELLVRNRKYN